MQQTWSSAQQNEPQQYSMPRQIVPEQGVVVHEPEAQNGAEGGQAEPHDEQCSGS
jgi:hypothetical protein